MSKTMTTETHVQITRDLEIGSRIRAVLGCEGCYGPGDEGTVLGWDSLSILVRFDASPTVNDGHASGVDDEPCTGADASRCWWIGHYSDETEVL